MQRSGGNVRAHAPITTSRRGSGILAGYLIKELPSLGFGNLITAMTTAFGLRDAPLPLPFESATVQLVIAPADGSEPPGLH
jgi:hypothetical protein